MLREVNTKLVYYSELWRSGNLGRGFSGAIPELALKRFATAVGKKPAYVVPQGAELKLPEEKGLRPTQTDYCS